MEGLIKLFAAITPDAPHNLDPVLATLLGAIMTLMALAGWFIKGKISAYDKHLEECRERAIVTARTEEKVRTIETKVDRTSETTIWLGDCMVTIGTKMGAELPDRPK